MLCSETMRLGAMVVRPTHGPIFEFMSWDSSEPCGACALGTLWYAIEKSAAKPDIARYDKCKAALIEYWPWLGRTAVHPETHGYWPQAIIIIVSLFEEHQWSRERIADWVATVEPMEQSEPLEVAPTSDAVDVLSEPAVTVHARI
jgi:hypothetical protein